MRLKLILFFFIIILISVSIYIIFITNKKINTNDKEYIIQNIKEKILSSNIDAYYPLTKHINLNNNIKKFINNQIYKFKKEIENNKEYKMDINFDYYETDTHISVVFNTFIDLILAHPMTYINTINYNKINSKVETIQDYIKKDKQFLNKISILTYNELIKKEIYKDIFLAKYMKNELYNNKDIYNNYVKTKNGFIFIFEQYKIAPYSYGQIYSNVIYP